MFWGLHIFTIAVMIEIEKDFFIEKNQYWLVMYQFGFSYMITKTQFYIQTRESFINENLHLIVNGSNLSWIFVLWLKIHNWVFNRKTEGGFSNIVFVLRYYTNNRRYGSNPKRKVRISFLGTGFLNKTGLKLQVQKWITPPRKKQKVEFFHIFFVSFWRHGRAVRRGTANPFSPVQIWVSPNQQKKLAYLIMFCWYNLTNFSSRSKVRGGESSWYLLDSISTGGFCSLKCCKSLRKD